MSAKKNDKGTQNEETRKNKNRKKRRVSWETNAKEDDDDDIRGCKSALSVQQAQKFLVPSARLNVQRRRSDIWAHGDQRTRKYKIFKCRGILSFRERDVKKKKMDEKFVLLSVVSQKPRTHISRADE